MEKFRVWVEAKKKKDNPQQLSIDFDAEPEVPSFRPCSIMTDYADGGIVSTLHDISRQVVYQTRPYKLSEFRAPPDWTDEDIASADPREYRRWMEKLARKAAEEDAKQWSKKNGWTISTF